MTDQKDSEVGKVVGDIEMSPALANQLKQLSAFLYDEGTPMKGCELSEEDAIALAKTHFPNKPYRLVANWRWINLDISESESKAVRDEGCEPCLIYASKILVDSQSQYSRGNWVRSTLHVSFTHGCLFETPNTIYVLMGEGSVKTEKPGVVMSIF